MRQNRDCIMSKIVVEELGSGARGVQIIMAHREAECFIRAIESLLLHEENYGHFHIVNSYNGNDYAFDNIEFSLSGEDAYDDRQPVWHVAADIFAKRFESGVMEAGVVMSENAAKKLMEYLESLAAGDNTSSQLIVVDDQHDRVAPLLTYIVFEISEQEYSDYTLLC